ncbi:hypothetical protein [Nocardia aurea]|uniref:Uncharacterized protein n=1 Tax=Nocardia aurea TaxID=2144174 RepID=A0ABV3FYR9_9NOCA
MDTMGEFVVGVDTAAVQAARRRTLRLATVSVVVESAGAVVISALAVFMVWLAGPIGFVQFAVVPFFVFGALRTLRNRRRLRDKWAAEGVVPTAMRLSANGLRLSLDGAPDSVFLPWDTLRGLRVHRWRGQQLLVVDLMSGVDVSTVGVHGLDHPEAQTMLRKRVHGTTGLRTAVRILTQPISAIDQAAAYFTAGRVRVH